MATRIVIAVYDTEENGRTEYTKQTINALLKTVDFKRHELFLSDNGSCNSTHDFFNALSTKWKSVYGSLDNLRILYNRKNLGTALAVNEGIDTRKPGQFIIKMDNDVVVHKEGWVDEMEEVMVRDENLGLLGLKRKDLEQRPDHDNPAYKSQLIMLPHQKGERWVVIEKAADIMGTCTMLSPKLLDKVGYFYQPALYGFDDVLMCIRCKLAGFYNAFLPHIEIEHIDKGGDAFCEWKTKHSGEQWEEIGKIIDEYKKGERPLYFNPFEQHA